MIKGNVAAVVAGSIPAGWNSSDAFPALQDLDLNANQMSGSIPSTLPAKFQGIKI